MNVDIDDEAKSATAPSYLTVLRALPDLPQRPIIAVRDRDGFERIEGRRRLTEGMMMPESFRDVGRHRPSEP